MYDGSSGPNFWSRAVVHNLTRTFWRVQPLAAVLGFKAQLRATLRYVIKTDISLFYSTIENEPLSDGRVTLIASAGEENASVAGPRKK